MDIDVLKDVGLTEKEIKIYVALLQIGENSAGPIKKETQLQNSVVHLCLNNLIDKGLVNYVEKGRRKFYSATDPRHLIDFIDEKKRRLQEIIPFLVGKQGEQGKYQVHLYEGVKGLKAIHEDILRDLKRNDEFLVLGAPREAHDKFEPYFLDFHKRRIRVGIKLRSIYKIDARKYAEVRVEMPFTRIRYMSDRLASPMWITIYKNKSILFVVGDILLGIVIENKTISENFREYFELIWKISKSK